MGGDDSQEHRERVDRRISDCRSVRFRLLIVFLEHSLLGVIRECECRRIRATSGQYTHKGSERNFHGEATYQGAYQERNYGNDGTVENPGQTTFVDDGVYESGAGLKTHASEKKGDSYFTNHKVRTCGGVGYQMEPRSEVADENRYDERSSGQS